MRIAVYMRLSKEDGQGQESSSIRGQRLLLRAYAKEHFPDSPVVEFQDDGHTGLHLDRPGLKAMLTQVRRGQIDCVMVKDFSRFSRDYLELGAYVQRIFPLLGVRFISVGDGYDSMEREDGPGLAEQFQGFVYHLYSRDLSVKVKTALDIRRKQGKYVWGRCPFGYKRDLNGRGGVEPREEEIQVVREIFRLALEGRSTVAIAGLLNEKGIPTPMEALCRRGESQRRPKKGLYLWSHETVGRILENPFYAGDLPVRKTQALGAGKRRAFPKEEWELLRDHHQAAVERRVFEQASLRRRKARGRRQPSRPLTGLLACGSCGRGLVLRQGKAPAYYCQRRRENGFKDCGFLIEAEAAEQAVLGLLRLFLSLPADRERLKGRLGAKVREMEGKAREEGLKQRRREASAARRRSLRYEREGTGVWEGEEEGTDKAFWESLKAKAKGYREALSKIDAPGAEWLSALGLCPLGSFLPSFWISRIVFYGPGRMEIRWRFRNPWLGEGDAPVKPSAARQRE